jgi:hypothetical protein
MTATVHRHRSAASTVRLASASQPGSVPLVPRHGFVLIVLVCVLGQLPIICYYGWENEGLVAFVGFVLAVQEGRVVPSPRQPPQTVPDECCGGPASRAYATAGGRSPAPYRPEPSARLPDPALLRMIPAARQSVFCQHLLDFPCSRATGAGVPPARSLVAAGRAAYTLRYVNTEGAI